MKQIWCLASVGEEIRKERKLKGMTVTALAKVSGVSRARLDAIENGRSGNFGVRSLLLILNALKLEMKFLPDNHGIPTLHELWAMQEEEDRAQSLRK